MHSWRPYPDEKVSRDGFTLLEVLLAVMLVNLALLALVSATTILVRQINEEHARASAFRAAANRLQLLGASGCAATGGSAQLTANLRETWTVVAQANGIRELADSATFTVPPLSERAVVLRTRLPC